VFPPDRSDFEDCFIRDVRITLHITSATGFTARPRLFLGHCGSGFNTTGGGFSGCSGTTIYDFDSSASGNQLGTNCSDFAFDTAAGTPLDPAVVATPYSGTWQLDPDRSGIGRFYNLRGLELDFGSASADPADAVLECARIEITTQSNPFP
jgi:hypothetical protein